MITSETTLTYTFMVSTPTTVLSVGSILFVVVHCWVVDGFVLLSVLLAGVIFSFRDSGGGDEGIVGVIGFCYGLLVF